MVKKKVIKKKKKKNKALYIVGAIFLLIIVFNAITELPYSGERYEKNVLEELKNKYQEEFVVVGKVSLVKDQYQILKVSPKKDPGCVFYAKISAYSRGSGTGRNRVQTHYDLEDDYIGQKYLQYAPDIFSKDAGISIDKEKLKKDYQPFIPGSKRTVWGVETFLPDSELVIKDVNKENLNEKAKIITNILTDLSKKEPFTKYGKYYEDVKLSQNFDAAVYYQTSKGEDGSLSLRDIYGVHNKEENIRDSIKYWLDSDR